MPVVDKIGVARVTNNLFVSHSHSRAYYRPSFICKYSRHIQTSIGLYSYVSMSAIGIPQLLFYLQHTKGVWGKAPSTESLESFGN